MPVAETSVLNTYYEMSAPDRLDAPRLLFIGGTGGDLRVKPNIMASTLAKKFHLLAFDQRGLGQTTGPDGPWTMEQYADDAAALMDHIGWDTAHIYGVSFGGMVAQNFVLRHPGRTEKLVLACTSAGRDMASWPLHTLDHMAPRERFDFMLGISDTRNTAAWQSQNRDRVDAMWAATVAQREHIAVTEAATRGAFWQLDARKDHDTCAGLGDIKAETFVCGGKYDGIAPPANLEHLHENIAGSALRFYEGGHLFLVQDRQATIDIGTFLIEGFEGHKS